MREIILVFEGHEESEKKAADTIQTAIFNALGQERMTVRQFINQMTDRKKRVVIGTPEQVGQELEIPEFLRHYNRQFQEGIQPSKK